MSGIAGTIPSIPSRALFLRVAILCAMVAFLDGFDSTSMAPAGPAIIETLHLSSARLGPLVSAALLGAMIGALSFGNLADRFGRKPMLLLATLVFGALTLATAYCQSFTQLILVRFVAGLGLGGATPCFIAIVSDYAPKERRARVTSAIWTAFPVGNVVGALFSAFLLAKFSWHSIFITGGILPLLVLAALLVWLPNTKRVRAGAATDVAGNIAMPTQEEPFVQARLASLFSAGNVVNTLLLWLAFLIVFGVTAAVFYFSPQLMHAHGIPLKFGALVLGFAGIGSLLGSPAAGYLIEKFGAGIVMTTTLVLGSLGVAVVGYMAGSIQSMMITLAFLGVFVSGMGISGVLAVAAITYPSSIRSTGIGGAVAFGRFGQVIMPLVISGMQFLGVESTHLFLFVAPLLLVGALAIGILVRRQHRAGSLMGGFIPAT